VTDSEPFGRVSRLQPLTENLRRSGLAHDSRVLPLQDHVHGIGGSRPPVIRVVECCSADHGGSRQMTGPVHRFDDATALGVVPIHRTSEGEIAAAHVCIEFANRVGVLSGFHKKLHVGFGDDLRDDHEGGPLVWNHTTQPPPWTDDRAGGQHQHSGPRARIVRRDRWRGGCGCASAGGTKETDEQREDCRRIQSHAKQFSIRWAAALRRY